MNLTPYYAPAATQVPSPNLVATFFAAVPPPWENLAAQELQEKLALLHFSPPEIKILPGGLEFSLPLREGFILNHYLKIPTRILLRLAAFKCRDFPTLYQKCSRILWGQYLNQRPAVSFSVGHSRLVHSGKAAQAVQDAVQNSWRHSPPSPGNSAATIFVRLVNDQAQISLDTSGERLDRRHYRTQIGRAPLRENLAAALLYQLAKLAPSPPSSPLNLFSPMCGSGTFLTEAASFYFPAIRPFAYQSFPAARKIMIPPAPATPLAAHLFAPGGVGMDYDPAVLAAAKANEQTLHQAWPQLKPATWLAGDVLQEKAKLDGQHPWAIIINPPLNQRLKVLPQLTSSPISAAPAGPALAAYYRQLVQQMRDFYHPVLLGMLLPAPVGAAPSDFPTPAMALKMYNGGKPAVFACWVK